jgi:hypothetical protein
LKPLGGGDWGADLLILGKAESLACRLGSPEIKDFGLLRPRQYARSSETPSILSTTRRALAHTSATRAAWALTRN